MKNENREKARKQLDKRLNILMRTDLDARPVRGWIKAIREALGMTTAQLGKRMGVSQPQVVKMEQSETRNAITLATLERAAQALGCQLIYALVPHQPLNDIVTDRARIRAQNLLESTRQTMALEAQNVDPDEENEQLEQLVQKILSQTGSSLWEEV